MHTYYVPGPVWNVLYTLFLKSPNIPVRHELLLQPGLLKFTVIKYKSWNSNLVSKTSAYILHTPYIALPVKPKHECAVRGKMATAASLIKISV